MAADPAYLTEDWIGPLADAIAETMTDVYLAETAHLIDRDPRPAGSLSESYDLEADTTIREQARQIATARLRRYGESLADFLDTQPDDVALADWLTERALSDAGIWARGDALETRRTARQAFYQHNRPPADKRWSIQPGGAAEARCAAIAGQTFPSYDAADSALGGAWHRNCQHYVDMAE